MKLSALALAFGLTLAAANPIVCIACINAGACDSMADKYNEPEGCDPMADPTMDNPCYIKCQSHLETSTDCYCTYAQKEDLDEKSAAGEETSWVPED